VLEHGFTELNSAAYASLGAGTGTSRVAAPRRREQERARVRKKRDERERQCLECKLNRGRDRFLLCSAAFLGGRLAVALLQIRQNHREHELLFAVIVEFDGDVLFGAGEYAAQSKFRERPYPASYE
jgi:hypothetical protein